MRPWPLRAENSRKRHHGIMSSAGRTMTTAAHESAHAVAAYLVGIPLRKVEVWDGGGQAWTGSRPSSDPFAHAVVMLAGGEYMRAIGSGSGNDDTDFTGAAILVAMQFDDQPKTVRKAAAKQAFGIVLEATRSLVESRRFRNLVAMLAPVLAEKGWNYGPDVLKFLRENDPEAPPHHAARRSLEAHSAPVSTVRHDDGSVSLYSNGRLLVSRGSEDEVEQLSAEILEKVWR